MSQWRIRTAPRSIPALVALGLAAACSSGHGVRASTTTAPGGGTTTVEPGTLPPLPPPASFPVTSPTTRRAPTSTAAATTTAPPTTAAASGVQGTVTAGPTCPVQSSTNPCPPRPVQATLRLLTSSGTVAASGQSASDGTFSIVSAPGSYTLQTTPQAGTYRCPSTPVTVRSGQYTKVDVVCDTGIR